MFCPQTWHFTATAVVPGRLTSRGLDLDRWIGDMRGEELSGAFGTQADESRGWTLWGSEGDSQGRSSAWGTCRDSHHFDPVFCC